MSSILDLCRFNPTAGGVTDWTFSSVVGGYNTPALAGAQDGRKYTYRAEGATLVEWEEGETTWVNAATAFTRDVVYYNSSGTGTKQSGAGTKINFSTVPVVGIVATKADMLISDEIGLACGMSNGKLVASAAAGALTVAVKTVAGNDPSPVDPVWFYFRNNTLGTGDTARVAVTAALSVVLGSTKTLGAINATGLRVWIAAFNNAGTVQLAAMNCSDANGVFSPQESTKFTTAVPASASKTWYSTAAIVTAAPWRFIGFVEWISLTTAGTWVVPDIVQLFGPGIPKPGHILQTVQSTTTTSDVGSNSTTYAASTFTATITPQSTANLVKAEFIGGAFPTGTNNCQMRLQRGTTWTGASSCSITPGTVAGAAVSKGIDQPSSTGALTYTVYRRVNNAATSLQCPYCNAAGDTNVIIVEELMG